MNKKSTLGKKPEPRRTHCVQCGTPYEETLLACPECQTANPAPAEVRGGKTGKAAGSSRPAPGRRYADVPQKPFSGE